MGTWEWEPGNENHITACATMFATCKDHRPQRPRDNVTVSSISSQALVSVDKKTEITEIADKLANLFKSTQ